MTNSMRDEIVTRPKDRATRKTGRRPLQSTLAAVGVVGLGGFLLAPSSATASPTPAPTISIFAGNGTNVAPTPGPATHSSIGDVEFGLAFDASGNAYIADDNSDYVYKVTPAGTLSIFAGNATDTTPTPGPATHSSIGDPEGLAFDGAGNLYIADDDNDHVYKVTPGGTLSIFAGNGSSGAVNPGPARSEPISGVDGVAVDRLGDVYIVSYGNKQVYKVDPAGSLSVFAGIAGVDAPPTPGPATHSSLGFPEGIATDMAGNVYVTDDDKDYVDKITPSGILSIFAGNGTELLPTPGRAANQTAVGDPEYVAVNESGDVFVTDDNNERVYEITPSEKISILAGTGAKTKAVPGLAASSPVGEPEAIVVNPSNQVIVSDVHDDTSTRSIRIFHPSPAPRRRNPPLSACRRIRHGEGNV